MRCETCEMFLPGGVGGRRGGVVVTGWGAEMPPGDRMVPGVVPASGVRSSDDVACSPAGASSTVRSDALGECEAAASAACRRVGIGGGAAPCGSDLVVASVVGGLAFHTAPPPNEPTSGRTSHQLPRGYKLVIRSARMTWGDCPVFAIGRVLGRVDRKRLQSCHRSASSASPVPCLLGPLFPPVGGEPVMRAQTVGVA